jgi:hypothetical protein
VGIIKISFCSGGGGCYGGEGRRSSSHLSSESSDNDGKLHLFDGATLSKQHIISPTIRNLLRPKKQFRTYQILIHQNVD